MMSDKEFAELELRATICPGQCEWPKPENIIWQKLHAVPNEARERVSKVYAQMDESMATPTCPAKTSSISAAR